jgi:predicted metalloprotease with PDZ domain
MHARSRILLLHSLLLAVAAWSPAAHAANITLTVDATQAPEHIFRARLAIPAAPGPLALYYPKWTQGEHAPSGPIINLTGLSFSAGGKRLAWRRDPLEPYTFHLDVPAGVTSVEVALDYVSPSGTEPGNRPGPSATERLAVVDWHYFLLYPAGTSTDQLGYAATLRLPVGWKYGTALPVAREQGQTIEFQPAPLATLVDSPVLAGAEMRTVDLSTPPSPASGPQVPHLLHLAGDSAAALALPAEMEAALRRLVVEATALFGSRHYRGYHFLLALTDRLRQGGLEHHESSDNRIAERGLIDDDLRKIRAGLLPHEFVHSWNGKYRRPLGLVAPDFQKPLETDLLWVYEGLTTYLGQVLTARSGLYKPEQYREALALDAAIMDHRAGRAWRPLVDTAVGLQVQFNAPTEWESWRRSVDYYTESNLIWLEADVLLRQMSRGQRSLGDFARRFFDGEKAPPTVKPYSREDLLTALGAVQPYDWRGFFATRVDTVQPRAPLGGITGAGWRLVYNDKMNEFIKARDKASKSTDASFSLGVRVRDDGVLVDVIPGLPAARAGVAPGMKLIAVNGRRWTAERLRDALKASRGTSTPIELLLENGDFFRTARVDYHDGERYPHLERDPARADLLTPIISPLAPAARR